jgi:hypothetical protein
LTIGRIVARGNRVLLVGGQIDPGPIDLPRIQPGPLPRAAQPRRVVPRPVAEHALAPIDTVLARVQAKWPDKVTLLRVIDRYCDRDCPIVKDDLWLFSNRSHLNKAGSQYMVSRSEDEFRRFLTTGQQRK